MRQLFDGIPLDQVTTSMTINSTATTLLALYLAVAQEQGVAWERVGGTVQNDILKSTRLAERTSTRRSLHSSWWPT